MNRGQTLFALLATACAASIASPAAAQRYNADCKEVAVPPDDIDIRMDILKSWPPTGMGFVLADKMCKGVEFVREVFSSEKEPEDFTPRDVFQALKPEVKPELVPPAYRGLVATEKSPVDFLDQAQKNAESYTLLPPARMEDAPVLFSGDGDAPPANAGAIAGQGLVLSEDGIAAGTFANGRLEGQGQQLSANGTWRLGMFDDGKMNGFGVEIGERNGKQYALSGNFANDLPDGQAHLAYDDGTSRNQLWRGGKVIGEGSLAAAGKEASDVFDPDGRWAGGTKYKVASNIEQTLDVVTIDGKTYLVGQLWDGKRDGMMQRIFADGSVQYEEWRNGGLLQSGQRGEYATTIAPQSKAQPVTQQAYAAPSPSVSSSASSARWSSVCVRNGEKIKAYLTRVGGIPNTVSLKEGFMRLWAPCRSYDPASEQYYQNNSRDAEKLRQWGTGDPDPQKTAALLGEIDRAITDPNYSAEYGTVRNP